jgi:hypothetical protein
MYIAELVATGPLLEMFSAARQGVEMSLVYMFIAEVVATAACLRDRQR